MSTPEYKWEKRKIAFFQERAEDKELKCPEEILYDKRKLAESIEELKEAKKYK